MQTNAAGRAIGLDFGTTNTVAALSRDGGSAELIGFEGAQASGSVFRSALCFWQDEGVRGGLAYEAGPWAIAEYLDYPQGSRFIQSFKSVAASPLFEHASVFDKRFRFEELGQRFLERLTGHAGSGLDTDGARIVVGRPVDYAGARADPALARERYDRMFAGFGAEVHYVYEPLGAAFSFASRLTEPTTVLVADFGGGTSDFSIVRVAEPEARPRCVPLSSSGVGIAGDRFDSRIVERLVLPLLGKGGLYRSFDKILEIPAGYFSDFSDWSKLALMRNRRTLDELGKLRRSAVEPHAIDRMIAVIENELGYALYDAVGQLKRTLSSEDRASFRFTGGGLDIEAEVNRADFEGWIAPDVARIEAAVDQALARAGMAALGIDRVFLTGGSSLIPAIRAIFARRFGEDRIGAGGELTSIAHGLALIGQSEDIAEWAV
ncbi:MULTISPECIES: Hsp70 family protein [unclassified Sphingomonas]|uniref:Hsp70 family protein n=1 Tax=unclassified Sphingomonas TaxID=196159 RepID=UPI0006F25EBA|nr:MULTISPECIES: Hsp70 family protein [unclassified Sphingomonas]KQX26041.1 molecular chaperone Hsp70 [Sphingomonas sp. Root1294]KQY69107.1 molecular chaperone Hsp70 [Sphingomonas sp. Root50]KRB89362.1 molecular chaperone Hsp70 [Sphingomonas sp. Root720]